MNQNCDEIHEVPPHVSAKGKMPSVDEKPAVQIVNESLTDESPTGYAKHCEKSSGIDGDAGDWTAAGQDAEGFPVEKGSVEDITE